MRARPAAGKRTPITFTVVPGSAEVTGIVAAPLSFDWMTAPAGGRTA